MFASETSRQEMDTQDNDGTSPPKKKQRKISSPRYKNAPPPEAMESEFTPSAAHNDVS